MNKWLIKKNKEKGLQKHNEQEFRNFLNSWFDMDNDDAWLSNNYHFEEDDNKYEVKVQLPGVKKDEIDLSFKDDTLFINWKHESKHESSSGTQSFYLQGASLEDIKAELKDGILTVEVLKTEEAKAKQISIN